jgi:hypothetical protein
MLTCIAVLLQPMLNLQYVQQAELHTRVTLTWPACIITAHLV